MYITFSTISRGKFPMGSRDQDQNPNQKPSQKPNRDPKQQSQDPGHKPNPQQDAGMGSVNPASDRGGPSRR